MTPVFAKVVDVHPESNTVDCVTYSDNRRLICVPVLGSTTGSSGTVDLHMPDLTTGTGEDGADAKWESLHTKARDIVALIIFAESHPVCLGFVSPPACELHMPPGNDFKDMRISRHASDVYSWTNKTGDSHWCHPNGSHMALATDPKMASFEKKDFDGLWKIRRNLSAVTNFFGSLFSGGARKTALKVKSGGDVQASSKGTIRITSASTVGDFDAVDAPDAEVKLGNQKAELFSKQETQIKAGSAVFVKLEVGGDITITAPGKVTVNSPLVHATGSANVDGVVTCGGLVVMGATALNGPISGGTPGGPSIKTNEADKSFEIEGDLVMLDGDIYFGSKVDGETVLHTTTDPGFGGGSV